MLPKHIYAHFYRKYIDKKLQEYMLLCTINQAVNIVFIYL